MASGYTGIGRVVPDPDPDPDPGRGDKLHSAVRRLEEVAGAKKKVSPPKTKRPKYLFAWLGLALAVIIVAGLWWTGNPPRLFLPIP